MAKIMLVEDDNNLREIYGARLLAEGHEIVAAKDGEEALALAVKEKPELIISDVMMPRISGFDMLDILRNAPETKNTKVIMMTALSQAEDKARADKLGADRYLVKSQVTLEDVAKAVNDVLAGTPSEPIEGVSGAQTTDPTPAPPVPTSSAPTPVNPVPQPQAATLTTVPNPIATPPVAIPEPTPIIAAAPVTDSPVAASPDPTSTLPSMSVPPVSAPTPEPTAPQSQTTLPEPAVAGQTPTTNPVALDPPTSTLAPDPSTAIPPPPPIEPPNTEPVEEPAATTSPDSTVAPLPAVDSPEATAPTPETPIKVELPTPPADLLTPDTSTATSETASTTEPVVPSVGPNLAEALQQEATDSERSEQPVTGSLTPEAPSIVNGAEDAGIIKPTIPKPEEQPDEPPSRAEPHPPDNPLDDTPKKKVIEPINDLTKKPDLAALAAAEEGVGTVLNPGGEAVVAPNPDEPPPPSPAVDDHSKIAL